MQGKSGELTRFASHAGVASVQPHDGLDDGESQSGPRVGMFACVIHLIEAVENSFCMLAGDAGAGVADTQFHGVARRGESGANFSTRRCMADGVG